MNDTLIFALPGNENLAKQFAETLNVDIGVATIRRFPDGESYVRVGSDVTDKRILLIATLADPDPQYLPLLYTTNVLKELGAKAVYLIAPYLAYMRQDKRFNPGESVTAKEFSKLISQAFNGLVTVDPHLHRIHDLSEIYTIPSFVVYAEGGIALWLEQHVENGFLIGPDSESEQWVSRVAAVNHMPYVILEKERLSDREVKLTMPDISAYQGRHPILVDDIISTAGSMIATIEQLNERGFEPPTCIATHAVFAEDAYEKLQAANVKQIVTCNTIPHVTNQIVLNDWLVDAIEKLLTY